MRQIQRISVTQARNDFFNLLKRSFLEKQSFIIEKGGIPLVYWLPISEKDLRKQSSSQRAKMRLLKKLARFRASMKESSDAVKLLREIRRYES